MMRYWLFLFGGLILWTAHFFAVYIIASVWPSGALPRLLVGGATVAGLAAAALLFAQAAKQRVDDEIERWAQPLSRMATGLAALAMIWQALPAIIPN